MRQTENYGDTVGKYEMVSGVWLNQRTVFLGRGPSGNGDFAGKIIEVKWWNGWWPEGKKAPPIFDLTDLLCWLMVIPSGNRFLALENTWESVCCDWRNNLEWNFNERSTSAKVCRLPKGFKGYIILPGLISILWKGMIGMPMIQAIDLSARGFGSCSHVDVLIGKIQCFQHSFNLMFVLQDTSTTRHCDDWSTVSCLFHESDSPTPRMTTGSASLKIHLDCPEDGEIRILLGKRSQ